MNVCTLLNSVSKIDHKLLNITDSSLTQTLLFGNLFFTTNDNTKTINLTIDFFLSDSMDHFFEQWLFPSLTQTIINKLALNYSY